MQLCEDNFVINIYPNTPIRLIQEHLQYIKAKEWLDVPQNSWAKSLERGTYEAGDLKGLVDQRGSG